MRFLKYLSEAPIQAKGWTQESIKKFEKTIGKKATSKGFFDACVARMAPKEGFGEENAKKFCASIKDAAFESPMWRGKGKKPKEAKAQAKEKPFPKSKLLKRK